MQWSAKPYNRGFKSHTDFQLKGVPMEFMTLPDFVCSLIIILALYNMGNDMK